jgi:nucleoside-diphosphate-sugar epimerase
VKVLVLGGTKFLGRAVVDAALAAGHELTLFNRGQTNPGLYPDVEQLHGDRTEDLGALRGRHWDAVVDTSGFVPHVVRAAASTLDDAGLYCFVSSVSAYASFAGPVREGDAEAELGNQPAGELLPDYANYGALKVLCERAVKEVVGERAFIVRPGLIVGPHDPTGRFTYWPHRFARGGHVLAAGPPERVVQFIDVRDLGEWIVHSCARGLTGTFNATAPGILWGELTDACVAETASGATPVWVDDEFLVAQGVGEWMELPLWIADRGEVGIHMADVSRAQAEGLTVRLLEETVRATLALAEPTAAAGLTAEREAELLVHWRERAS